MTPAEAQPQLTRLFLPWPSNSLSPNARVHWAARARLVKAALQAAFYAAREAKVQCDLSARLEFYFHPPDARKRDLHNMPGHFGVKAYIDGIAHAMGCDDRGFRVSWPDEWGAPVRDGRVVVWIRTGTEDDSR
jgi:crossover junction endodeoxyribonuclease RusA